jgi:opacity protein-like surface antigen
MHTRARLLMTTALGAFASGLVGHAQAADALLTKAPILTVANRPWYLEIEGGVGIFTPHDTFGGFEASAADLRSSLWGAGGPIVGARFGYQFTPMLRADLSFHYMSFTLTGFFDEIGCAGSGECTANATRAARAFVEMANGYVDLGPLLGQRLARFRPYLTAGVGAAQDSLGANCLSCSFSGANGSKTTDHLAWAVGAGMRVNLFEELKLDVAYRFYDLGRFQAGFDSFHDTGGDSFRVNVHAVTAGLVMAF